MGRAVVVAKLKQRIRTVPGITRLKYTDEFHQKVIEQQKKIDEEERERERKQKKEPKK